MILVMGDLIADLALRIRSFPIAAQDLQPVEYLEIGPGGATNIAIMAARFGLEVECIGEVGRDAFGEVVMRGLAQEGIATRNVVVAAESKTPVAGVIVDEKREPAYLGYMGNLTVKAMTDAWCERIVGADALFADGWVEIAEMPQMILDAFRLARENDVKVFFDPGPGNATFDLEWHREGAALADVLLVNEQEAQRLTEVEDAEEAAVELRRRGTELVVLKRGERGMKLFAGDSHVQADGLKVEPVDFTGAGDSVTGAMLYGYFRGLDLGALGLLGNATGATKVQKLGTGHNMPTLEEIRETLRRFAPDAVGLLG